MEIQPVKASKFYNKNIEKFEIISMEDAIRNASYYKNFWNRMPMKLMGPTQFWQQFPRQAEALRAAEEQSVKETVCTFVYEKENGHREFIVAHPEVYWWYTMKMPSEKRCSYEVIPEGACCWLYFDLEYKLELNPEKNGSKMTETVMKIFCSYIEKYWNFSWDEKNIVNLDSTNSTKFSRHLIFCNENIAFRNNFHVGCLVKSVCKEIEEYLENSSVLHDILSFYERRDLEDLYVKTEKGNKIFIDTSVYSKNRHFRTYKSTKSGKMSHLEIAKDSKHVPLQNREDKDLAVFLDSLISFIPTKNKDNLELLEIMDNEWTSIKNYSKFSGRSYSSTKHTNKSRYPRLDKFILSIVKPGKIRVCKDLENQKIIRYEIFGNRYCANIGREHKSNNVFWIADIRARKIYQRCHDEDCANFVSERIDIPPDVSFYFDNEDDEFFFNVSEFEEDSK